MSCESCGTGAGVLARGWRAYRVSGRDAEAPLKIALFCPSCTETALGALEDSMRRGDEGRGAAHA